MTIAATPAFAALYLLRFEAPVLPLMIIVAVLVWKFDPVPPPVVAASFALLLGAGFWTNSWGFVALFLLCLCVASVAFAVVLALVGRRRATKLTPELIEALRAEYAPEPIPPCPPNGGIVVLDRKELLERGETPVVEQLSALLEARGVSAAELTTRHGSVDDTVDFVLRGRSYRAWDAASETWVHHNGELVRGSMVAMATVLDDWIGSTFGPRWRVIELEDGLFAIVDCADADIEQLRSHVLGLHRGEPLEEEAS